MKKPRHTKEQMLAVYSDWQQSGLDKKAYCKQIGLATSTFFYWVKKFAQKEGASDAGFTELDFSAKDDPIGSVLLEIAYPSGTKIKFYRQPKATWVKTLAGCCLYPRPVDIFSIISSLVIGAVASIH